jgi:hypothetical protein
MSALCFVVLAIIAGMEAQATQRPLSSVTSLVSSKGWSLSLMLSCRPTLLIISLNCKRHELASR